MGRHSLVLKRLALRQSVGRSSRLTRIGQPFPGWALSAVLDNISHQPQQAQLHVSIVAQCQNICSAWRRSQVQFLDLDLLKSPCLIPWKATACHWEQDWVRWTNSQALCWMKKYTTSDAPVLKTKSSSYLRSLSNLKHKAKRFFALENSSKKKPNLVIIILAKLEFKYSTYFRNRYSWLFQGIGQTGLRHC